MSGFLKRVKEAVSAELYVKIERLERQGRRERALLLLLACYGQEVREEKRIWFVDGISSAAQVADEVETLATLVAGMVSRTKNNVAVLTKLRVAASALEQAADFIEEAVAEGVA